MSVTYKSLIELIAARQKGIIGEENTRILFEEAGLPIDDKGRIKQERAEIADISRLINKLNDRYGLVAVMGCKIAVMRKAREGGLELPDVFH